MALEFVLRQVVRFSWSHKIMSENKPEWFQICENSNRRQEEPDEEAQRHRYLTQDRIPKSSARSVIYNTGTTSQ
jgi:hypothetical protein